MARGDVVLVDVRPAEEFEAGHIDGAQSIPIEELKRRLDELPGDREVVAYCRGPFCAYAHEAVRALRAEGRSARRLEDGWPEWRLSKGGDRQHDAQRLANSTPPSSSSASSACTRRWRSSPSATSTSRRAGRSPSGSATRPTELDRIPAAAIDSFAGVGYFLDLAAIQPGEAVLDLGSGSGTDSFLAALAGGPNGRVVGVDMTDAAARQGEAPGGRGRLRQRRVPRRLHRAAACRAGAASTA